MKKAVEFLMCAMLVLCIGGFIFSVSSQPEPDIDLLYFALGFCFQSASTSIFLVLMSRYSMRKKLNKLNFLKADWNLSQNILDIAMALGLIEGIVGFTFFAIINPQSMIAFGTGTLIGGFTTTMLIFIFQAIYQPPQQDPALTNCYLKSMT